MSENYSNQRSQRQLKVGETLRHALSEYFIKEDIYGQNGENICVTISEVRISPDLHNATVFYMPLGGKDKESIGPLLNQVAPMIRSGVSRMVHLRHTPALYFKIDETFDNAAKMNDLINSQNVSTEE
jgi:ribosome-binding factor A